MPKENEKSELYVITCVEKLIEYSFIVTAKIDKTYRFTMTTRMENYLLDGYEYLQLANLSKSVEKRLEFQRFAYAKFKLFGNFINLSRQNKLISENQFLNICEMLSKSMKYLQNWIAVTIRRVNLSVKNR